MTAANICLRIVLQSSTYVAALPAPEAKTFSSYFCFLDSSQIFIYQKKSFSYFPFKVLFGKILLSPPLSCYLGMHQIVLYQRLQTEKNIISFKIFVMMVGYWKFFLSFELFKNVGRDKSWMRTFLRGVELQVMCFHEEKKTKQNAFP